MAAVDLLGEFGSAIHSPLPPKAQWRAREIEGRTVRWAEGRFDDMPFTFAFWTRDGLVVQVTGQPTEVEAAISRLP